jgi:hypothetical protein
MNHGVEAMDGIMKLGVENKLLEIFETFGLPWV